MKKQITISALLRNLLAILTGFVIIFVLSSILAHLQVKIYPRSGLSAMTGRTDLTELDTLNLAIRVAYVCLCCTVSGVVTTLIGRSLAANLIVGIGMTLFITVAALQMKLFHPVWYWVALIIFITPSVFLGFLWMK